MGTNVYEVMQRLAPPGEQVLTVVMGRSVQARAAAAALTLLVSPMAMGGTQCLVAITENSLMSVTWTAASPLIKPRKAWTRQIADVASHEYTTKKKSGRLELLLRDGKKVRFVLEDREGGDELVAHLEQARQRLGFHAGPGAPAAPAPAPYVPPQAAPAPHAPPAAPPAAPPVYTPPAAPAASSPGSSVFCIKCGTPADPDGQFCENCGARIERPKPGICPGCGIPRKPSAKFCGGCGHGF